MRNKTFVFVVIAETAAKHWTRMGCMHLCAGTIITSGLYATIRSETDFIFGQRRESLLLRKRNMDYCWEGKASGCFYFRIP